jgi:CubicO group peptidase (beta-lactamase class C family)
MYHVYFILCAFSPSFFSTQLDGQIEDIFQNAQQFGGVAYGIVIDQELVFSNGFGYLDNSNPSLGAPTANTPFRIGSVSKVFTAMQMFQQRDKGKVWPHTSSFLILRIYSEKC